MTAFGKANYEAYREFSHGKSLVSGEFIPEWDHLPVHIQSAWDAGADAVAVVLADMPVDEDAPGNEPQPSRVVIVAETPATGLDRPVDRHFPDARGWEEFDDGRLHVFSRKARRIATYAPGRWMSVREDDEVLSDSDPSEDL